jgi:hypothetical protein
VYVSRDVLCTLDSNGCPIIISYFYSPALRIFKFIDHIVKTFLKCIKSAKLCISEFMNTGMFGHQGPIQPLRSCLGVATECNQSGLSSLLPKGYMGVVVPIKETDTNVLPFTKQCDVLLVLVFGFLRRLDAS